MNKPRSIEEQPQDSPSGRTATAPSGPLFAFFGTPHIATIVLDRLEANGLVPALIVTAPDKPAGRGLVRTASPVKKWAIERGIDVITPDTLKNVESIPELCNTDWDVFVVSMYAKILPSKVLHMPKRGCLNVHPSLLPAFRGPSPVLSAILEDQRTTGVTIMLLDEKMDEGPIIAQARVELDEEAWPPKGSEFEQFLAHEGGDLLAEALPLWVKGTITPEAQDSAQATYTKKFSSEDALVDLAHVADNTQAARKAFLTIRAFDTSPKPYFIASNSKRIIIKEAQWKNNALQITRVIPEGKKEMDYTDYLRGQ